MKNAWVDRATGAGLLLAAVAVAWVGAASLTVAAAAPRPGAPVLVVAAPWADAAAVVRAAGGAPGAPVDAPLAAVGVFDDPDFLGRLSAAGAWLVLDGAAVAAMCGVGQ